MTKYVIKIRVYPPVKIKLGVVEQILPDYDHPFVKEISVHRDSFQGAANFAMRALSDHARFIGVRAEIVSIAEV